MEDYVQVLGRGQLSMKQLPAHALEVPNGASIELITGGAIRREVYSNPIVGPRIDSDVYNHYIRQPASNGSLLKTIGPIQGGAYANSSNGFPYKVFYELQGGNMYRHGAAGYGSVPQSYSENIIGAGSQNNVGLCDEDVEGGFINPVALARTAAKLPGIAKNLRKTGDWRKAVKEVGREGLKHTGPLGELAAEAHEHCGKTWDDVKKRKGGSGEKEMVKYKEKRALKKIEKMMGGALSREEHEQLGNKHPAFGKEYKKYILQVRDKKGGSFFGDVWNGLKKAHNWVKENKIASKIGRAVQKGAEFVGKHAEKLAPIADFIHPVAGKAVRAASQIGNAAGKAADFAEKHGYGIQPERVYVNPQQELVYQLSGVPPNASSGRIITGPNYALA